MSAIVMVRMMGMMMTMVVLVMTMMVLVMAKVVKLTDSRPCSVPYGSGSVFNSTVRPELQRIDQNLIQFSKAKSLILANTWEGGRVIPVS